MYSVALRARVKQEIRKLAAVSGASITTREKGGNYPFPGWETFYHTQVEVPESFDRLKYFPHVRTRPSSGGPGMFWVLDHNIKVSTEKEFIRRLRYKYGKDNIWVE